MKEEMNSFDIAAVTVELDHKLKGFRVDNIYQINPKTLLLNLHGKEGARSKLLIEAGRRVHITFYEMKKPSKPTGFCMVLRKYLRNSVVEKVEQHGFERIIELSILGRGKQCRLVIEVFGNGNIILVDSNGKIVQALSYKRMRDRNVLRGENFHYPPQVGLDPRILDRQKLGDLKNYGSTEVVKALARFLGIGGFYAEEVLLHSGLPKNKPCDSLSTEELDVLFKSLRRLFSLVQAGHFEPYVYFDENGKMVDVAPFLLRRYGNFKRVQFDEFNRALDEFYSKTSIETQIQVVKDYAEHEIARLERILKDQEETLRESKQKAETYRKIGDLIYQHLGDFQLLLEKVMTEKRGGKNWKEISEAIMKEKSEFRAPSIYFRGLNPQTLELQVSVDSQSFSLNLRLSAQKNAAEYYELAKKAEKKAEGAQKAIEATREQMEKARLLGTEKIEKASVLSHVGRRREWFEKFRWFYSSQGLLVIGGRDATTNEIIVKKHVEPGDIVFHAEIQGAPFVVIKTGGAAPSEQTIKEAATFAASYSSAWKVGVSSVDVYWVRPEQVSKTPPSGEFLPKGAFMIYGTKNYVKGAVLEVAIGLISDAQNLRVIGGPPESVAHYTGNFVQLVPGRETSGKLAKQIRERLASFSSEKIRREVQKLPLEDIQWFIPPGGGTLK
ncbi:NFACT family protein [Candidatus Bathyarchaeota archaeon]|nr:NFACT family protein [Candidatus Bathyarchaeota archaeon]